MVGDYIFTDEDFVRRLSIENRNVFQKVYDEIKYLCKTATTASDEGRQLLKAKHIFEKMYREEVDIKNTTDEGGVKYSFGVTQNDINKYVDDAYDKTNTEDYKKYAEVSEKLIFDVSNEIDITGYCHALRDNDIRHIYNSHGEGTNEKYPVTSEDIKRIPWIVENYDKVYVVKKKSGKTGIFYVKASKDGLVYYLEQVTSVYGNEPLLVNKQMIKTGIEDIPDIKELKDAIIKKQSVTEFLDDLKKVPKVYAQGVYQSYSTDSISNSSDNVKKKQLEIIEKSNPAPDTYHTWVRSVEDIKTLSETLEDSEWADYDEFDPDLTRDMIEEAIKSGKITVYSSYPIEQGVFVSPSYMEAESYSGSGKVYEKTVNIEDVAWIDPTQGMYANTETRPDIDRSDVVFAEDNISSSSKEYIEKTNEILYNKNSTLSVENRAKTNNNSSLKWVYDAEIFSVEESKLFHEEISRINQNSGALDYTKNTAGEYMIPVGNKIVFTDGDYEYPYVREVIEVLTEYATEFEDIKRCIFNVEKGKSEKQDEARIIEQMYGTGYIISYNSGYDGVYAWENGRRKGRTRKEVIRNYLNKQFGKGNGRESQTAQVNEIAPIKETSSEGDVFFDAQNNADYSLSAPVSSEQRRRARDIYGDDVSLDTSENIAHVKEDLKASAKFCIPFSVHFHQKTKPLKFSFFTC